jgi:hypothetical protein
MSDSPDFDELLDPIGQLNAPKEARASERIEQAQRIARGNELLRREGQIADGSGKPAFRAKRTRFPVILVASIVGIGIVVIAMLAA